MGHSDIPGAFPGSKKHCAMQGNLRLKVNPNQPIYHYAGAIELK